MATDVDPETLVKLCQQKEKEAKKLKTRYSLFEFDGIFPVGVDFAARDVDFLLRTGGRATARFPMMSGKAWKLTGCEQKREKRRVGAPCRSADSGTTLNSVSKNFSLSGGRDPCASLQ